MSGLGLGLFVGALVLVLIVVALLMAWQEAGAPERFEGTVYVISDAVDHVWAEMDESLRGRVRRSDVLRILEYEIFYLQGLAQDDRKNPVETVAGGTEASVSFIASEIAERHGAIYAQEDIRTVLSLEAGYLAEIGAVGGTVEDNQEDST